MSIILSGVYVMVNRELVNRFEAAIDRAFSAKTQPIEDQLEFNKKNRQLFKNYLAAIEIIKSVKDADTLDELMRVYLVLFLKYDSNKTNIHSDGSDQTYVALFERCSKVNKDKRDLFAIWKPLVSPNAEANSFQKRFNELEPRFKREIQLSIQKEEEERRKTRCVLDVLRDEFLKQKGRVAKDSDLYDFDPHPREILKCLVQQQLGRLKECWTLCESDSSPENLKTFHESLDDYRKYLLDVSKEGPLQLFQVIKYLQDWLRQKEQNMGGWTKRLDGIHHPLMCEVYIMACIQLAAYAGPRNEFPQNRFGFLAAEQDYFLRRLREPRYRYKYVSNLENRLASRLTDVPAVFDQTKTFLDLILLTETQLRFAKLVTLQDTLRIQNMWNDIDQLTKRLQAAGEQAQDKILLESGNRATLNNLLDVLQTEVPIGQEGPVLGRGFASAGRKPGEHAAFGEITIVYIDPKNLDNFYIEYAALKPHLFLVDTNYISKKLFAGRLQTIYQNTIGVVYATNAMFLIMGFLPVFIQAGFAALLTEVIIYYGSTKLEEQAAKINPIFGKIVGLAAQILTPRPSHGPSIVGVEAAAATTERVIFLSVESVEARGFAEILASQEAAGKLIADFNRGTVSRAVVKLTDKIKDKFFAMRKVELASLVEEITSGSTALATNEGVVLRVAEVPTGTGARGLGGSVSRAESALQKSRLYSKLEEYYKFLTKEELLLAKNKINTVLDNLRKGTLKYSEASQQVLNVLNGVKEKTGEYVCDFTVLSNFEVLEVLSIPRRGRTDGLGPPVLDRVYKVKNPQSGQIEYLLAEVKGGERLRLGWVTKKTYEYKNNKLTITVVKGEEVRQASGEWYYQKIIEIYETGDKTLARKLFEAAKGGRIKSIIVKSGKELDPKITFNTAEIIGWFKGKKLPYD